MAIKIASCAHTKDDNYKKVYSEEIQELRKYIEEKRNELQKSLLEFQWLNEAMETPFMDKKTFENDNIDVIEYMKLKSELYSIISEWR